MAGQSVPTTAGTAPLLQVDQVSLVDEPASYATQSPLPWAERVWAQQGVRKGVILILLALLWEVAAWWTDNDLLLPGFLQTAQAFVEGLRTGELLSRAASSLNVLIKGTSSVLSWRFC